MSFIARAEKLCYSIVWAGWCGRPDRVRRRRLRAPYEAPRASSMWPRVFSRAPRLRPARPIRALTVPRVRRGAPLVSIANYSRKVPKSTSSQPDLPASGEPAPTPITAGGPRRPLLKIAFVLLAVEVVGLVVGAIWLLIDRPDGAMSSWGYALTMGAVLLAFAFLLVIGGRALWHGKRWGRGPVITWQILQIFTALTVFDIVGMAWTWAGALTGIVAMIGFLAPSSIAVTSETINGAPASETEQK